MKRLSTYTAAPAYTPMQLLAIRAIQTSGLRPGDRLGVGDAYAIGHTPFVCFDWLLDSGLVKRISDDACRLTDALFLVETQ